MSETDWDPAYAIGIPSIDSQHQRLFGFAATLNTAYRSGRAQQAIPDMLEDLVEYCTFHFTDEEGHMRRSGFPDLRSHRDEHRRLLARVHDLQDRFYAGEAAVAMELSILISQWLKTHIKERDRVLAAHLRSIGETGRP